MTWFEFCGHISTPCPRLFCKDGLCLVHFHLFVQQILVVSMNQTWIVGVEGEYADHKTTSTSQSLWFLSSAKFYLPIVQLNYRKDENKEKEAGNGRLKKSSVPYYLLTFPGLSVPPPGAQDQLHRPGLVWQPGVRLHLRVAGKRPQVLRDQDGEGGFAGREQEQLGRPSCRTTVSVCRPSYEGRTPFWRLLQKFKSPSQATVGFSGSITIKGDLWWKSYTLRNALKLDNLILNDRDSGFYWEHDMATMRHFFPWILGFFRL